MSAIAPEGRKLLRVEARNAAVPIEKKPAWIKTRARMGPEYTALKDLVRSEGLHTVCEEAGCPNIFECWEDREATFLIGGATCSRNCSFCQIDSGRPEPLDRDEPRRVAESVKTMGLRYATVTGVARDDLDDEGAWLYAQTVREIHAAVPGCGVELLTPDFHARPELLAQVFDAQPEVFAHNLETVPRIFKSIRTGFRYERSLEVIDMARDRGLVTKSNLILGLGEERAEISATLVDLRDAGCDLITITQYLRPSLRHHPVERWVEPAEFAELEVEARELGFAGVMSGPLVRSSYRAGRLYRDALAQRSAVPASAKPRAPRPYPERTMPKPDTNVAPLKGRAARRARKAARAGQSETIRADPGSVRHHPAARQAADPLPRARVRRHARASSRLPASCSAARSCSASSPS